jgi:hypothetical protein
MIILNLLPAEKKRGIAAERSQRLQRKLVVIFLSCLILSVAILFTAHWYIGYEIKSVDDQIVTAQQVLRSRGDDSNTQIEAMNAQLTQLQLIQKDHILWPSIVGQLTDSLVPGITLNSVAFDAIAQSVTLSGTALTRQNLVAYKEKLGSLPFISNIESPLSDLIQRENINFEFKGKFTISSEVK